MPNYCNKMTTVGAPPAPEEMEMMKPYFDISSGGDCTAVFKVPSECYHISSTDDGPPSQGPCGSSSDLQFTLFVDEDENCPGSEFQILNFSLPFHEDPEGNYLIVYVVNMTTGEVDAVSKTRKQVS